MIEATDGGGLSSRAIVIVLATGDSTVASVAPELPGMETFVPHPSWATTTSVPLMPRVTLGSAEEEETIQTFVTEVAENTPANTVVVTLGVPLHQYQNKLVLGRRGQSSSVLQSGRRQ